ncbi:MAG: arginine--tRNA ligase [Deltaproteobacteria bacterium]|nr:arginine--tRNA ligase [Deltaproteobacteria bacterium]
MKKRLTRLLEETIQDCAAQGLIPPVVLPPLEVGLPRDVGHGDYATNIAMILASRLKMNPRRIAEIIVAGMQTADDILEKIEIAGPGFINFFIKDDVWCQLLQDIDDQGEHYGENELGGGRKVQVEFVSANPTGPLHIGHARGAVVGDVIANILAACNYAVFREYYINDAGNQMQNLGRSVLLRYQELRGEQTDFPENCYRGDYIKDIARGIRQKEAGGQSREQEHGIAYYTDYAAGEILTGIKADLQDFGVVFDGYFSEKELYQDDAVLKLLDALEGKGFVYQNDGARWFKSTVFGDEKDRVVVRNNGEPTYFAADIAYHQHKYARGFDKVIDIWGADHHGYIPRLQAVVQALGYEKTSLQIVLVQLVNLLRDGNPVAMSTRSGEFVTMREVVDEVGKDAARYNFLMRRSDSHLDFDLELAKRQSNENPVYYVQYAHARICSILAMAREKGYQVSAFGDTDVGRLNLAEEVALIKEISRFPEVVAGAAQTLEPHRLTFYLNDLAGVFHNYYNKHRVVSPDDDLTKARLLLMKSVRTVIRSALGLLGVSAPEQM